MKLKKACISILVTLALPAGSAGLARADGASPSPSPSVAPSHAPSSQAQAYLNAIELAKSAQGSGTASANVWSAIAGYCGKVCSSYVNDVGLARRNLYESVRYAKKLADKGYWACPEVYLAFKDVSDPYEDFKKANDQADTHTQYAEVKELDQSTSAAEEQMVYDAQKIENTMAKAAKYSGFMLPHCLIYSRSAKDAVADLKNTRETLQAWIDDVVGRGKNCGSPALTQAANDIATNDALKKKSDENLVAALKAENMPNPAPSTADDSIDNKTFLGETLTASPGPSTQSASPKPMASPAPVVDIKYEETDSSNLTTAAKVAKYGEVSSVGMGACKTASEASKLAALKTNVATSNQVIMEENQKLYDALSESQAFRSHTPWEWVLYVGLQAADPLVSCAMAATESGSPLYSACSSRMTTTIPGRLSCAEAGDSSLHRALERDGQAVKAVLSQAQAEFNISDDELLSTHVLITPARVAQWMTSKHPSQTDAVLRFLQSQAAQVRASGSLGTIDTASGTGGSQAGAQPLSLNAPSSTGGMAPSLVAGYDAFHIVARPGIATEPALPEIARVPATQGQVLEAGFHAANESIFEVVTSRYQGLKERVQKLDYAIPANRR